MVTDDSTRCFDKHAGPCTNGATGRQMRMHELLSRREAPRWRVISARAMLERRLWVLDALRNDPTSHLLGRWEIRRLSVVFQNVWEQARPLFWKLGRVHGRRRPGLARRWASGMLSVSFASQGRWHALSAHSHCMRRGAGCEGCEGVQRGLQLRLACLA